jgi:hypothetical protein
MTITQHLLSSYLRSGGAFPLSVYFALPLLGQYRLVFLTPAEAAVAVQQTLSVWLSWFNGISQNFSAFPRVAQRAVPLMQALKMRHAALGRPFTV